jgi:steroid delta-isomerase-like uncharacterized protein
VSEAERNKGVVLAYVEAMNGHDVEALRRLFADDALISGVFGSAPLEQALPVFRELHEALAMSLTVEGVVAEGDTVVARYIERGSSLGPFRGQPATGRTYELDAMEWFTLADGRITRRWGARDSAAQARQLGW